ncbi:MAG: T9SS type A sorting domain-containing protein [bacterium]
MKHILICVLILAGISPAFGGTPTITNLTDQSFTVSWTTAASEKGWVEYGTTVALGMSAYDNRGAGTVDDTHYVTIKGLSGTITYYYQVVSGDEKSSIATITTVPAISLSQTGRMVIGRVYFQGTTIPAKGTIVYATLRTDSGTESDTQSTVGKDEPWYIPLDNFRSLDGCSQFQCSSGDTMVVEVRAAGDGIAAATATIATTTTNSIVDMGTITLAGDTSAPPDTSILQPTPKNGCISLSWNMPAISSGVSGILILRSQQGYPQAILTAGSTYTVGSTAGNSEVVCVAANTTTWTDETLTNGTTYYYRIFTHDGVYNYSPGIGCYSTPVANLDSAAIYPNPLIGDGTIYFDKLQANTHLCIYNTAGELVLEADAPSGTYSWIPKDIASGIYLYLLKDGNGHVRTGKVGIVK